MPNIIHEIITTNTWSSHTLRCIIVKFYTAEILDAFILSLSLVQELSGCVISLPSLKGAMTKLGFL